MLLQINTDASKEVQSLFFIPDKNKTKIEEVICVETHALTREVELNKEYATILVDLKNRVPHSLNAQASLTISDLRNIKLFSIR